MNLISIHAWIKSAQRRSFNDTTKYQINVNTQPT